MANFSLPGFAAHMLVLNRELKAAEQDILQKAAKMIEAEAKAAIGTYDFNWDRLKPETVAAEAERRQSAAGDQRAACEHRAHRG